MYSVFRKFAAILCFFCGGALFGKELPFRVCADPNNLPFSNAAGQGFENKIAKLVARELNRPLEFVWSPQRGNFVKKTLNAGACDAIIGLPASLDEAEMTEPYYRSTYVFVWRRQSKFAVHSFDDDSLRAARIGVQVIGHDSASVPPAQALIDRGLGANIVWYRLVPDFSVSNPPSSLINGLAQGDIDVAIAWGPMASYFAKHSSVPLVLAPVTPDRAGSTLLTFEISMAVPLGNDELCARLNSVIRHRKKEIENILQAYGVPRPSKSAEGSVSARGR